MDAKKNLCAMIPADLHAKVLEEKEQLGMKTLGDYVEKILKEHFEGGTITMTNMKTLALKIPEELDQRLKSYLKSVYESTGRKITQREFVIGLIEQALTDSEVEEPAEE